MVLWKADCHRGLAIRAVHHVNADSGPAPLPLKFQFDPPEGIFSNRSRDFRHALEMGRAAHMSQRNSMARCQKPANISDHTVEAGMRNYFLGMRNMIVRSGFGWLLIVCAVAITFPASVPVYASQVLITEDEAKLPPPKGAFATDRRGITRGPKIDFIPVGEPIHSPMHLRMKFESFGGAKINLDSVKITYLRTPNVDLTPRVKFFVQPTGIDMPDVQLPVGDHMLRVDLKDSDGRPGSTSFVLKVEP
jgi:hypothetical protein